VNKKIIAILGLCLVAGVAFWALKKGKLGKRSEKSEVEVGLIQNKNKGSEFGLKLDDLKVGEGVESEFGDTVEVHYVGMLEDGKKFDSTRDRQQPMHFLLGAGQILQGLDMGVAGMKVKGQRKITVPPKFGYGAKGAGGGLVPPDATLIYEVELLKLDKRKTPPDVNKKSN
jgi:FKBP-type peptidyl-prolyl cis-trans isomerase